jgi:hypothetical protein
MKSLLDSTHQRALAKRWKPIIESGDKINNEYTKVALAQVLENTYADFARHGLIREATASAPTPQPYPVGTRAADGGYMAGQRGYDNGGNYGDFYLPNVVMPILRRIFPQLIANDLVGVQPLNGPVGLALALRAKYAGNGYVGVGTNQNVNEIGFAPVDTSYAGISGLSTLTPTGQVLSGDTLVSANVSADDAFAYYLGQTGNSWTGTGVGLGNATEFASLDNDFPQVSFDLVKQSVEAKTRKLGAHWSPELAEDMQAMHGIDVETEMVNILSYEIGAEIDRQIVTEMVRAAITGGAVSEWTPVSADGLDQMGRLATLLTQITVQAQQIALQTRRGAANFVITSPRVTALLEQLSMNKFTSFKNDPSMPSVPDTGVGALTKVGYVNNDSQLLVRDSYAQNDYVLMGYKGTHPGDSGIIYCPYIPVQLSRVMIPQSFTPAIGARTRYGVMANPWDAKNYYHFMKITGLTGSVYTWDGARQFIAPTVTVANPSTAGVPVLSR